MSPRISFHSHSVGGEEEAAVRRAIRQGRLAGHGPLGRRVEASLARKLGVERAFLTPSGTAALELALMALGVGPGDEVILPSFNFVSDATAVLRQGARPVFADVLPGTLGLDPQDVRRRLTRRTKAILLVHYGGVACDMAPFLAIRRERKLALVEDAALALGATWRGRPLGTIGDLGCFSFHATKQVTCGEGGALVSSRLRLARRIEVLREKGTDRSSFLRGERDRYTWRDQGSSFLLSDLLAAVLEVQLRGEAGLRRKLLALWRAYQRELGPLEEEGLLRLAHPSPDAGLNGHLFWLQLQGPWKGRRSAVLKSLRRAGVSAAFHYLPLHSSPYGRSLRRGPRLVLKVTESAGRDLIRLPLHGRMNVKDAVAVAAKVMAVLRNH